MSLTAEESGMLDVVPVSKPKKMVGSLAKDLAGIGQGHINRIQLVVDGDISPVEPISPPLDLPSFDVPAQQGSLTGFRLRRFFGFGR